MKTHTRGNVIVENIKIGDIHYEYEYGMCVMSQVLTLPEMNDDGAFEWTSKKINSIGTINYLVDPKYAHYSAKLYDYEAYQGVTYI